MATVEALRETRVVHAVCSHDCPDSCGVLVTVETLTGADGAKSERAVKVAGDPKHPVTRGFLCGKVAKYLDRVYSPDRLLYPMRRRQGAAKGPVAEKQIPSHSVPQDGTECCGTKERDSAFEPISWDEALDEIKPHG